MKVSLNKLSRVQSTQISFPYESPVTWSVLQRLRLDAKAIGIFFAYRIG
jgi:hypothetical protein